MVKKRYFEPLQILQAYRNLFSSNEFSTGTSFGFILSWFVLTNLNDGQHYCWACLEQLARFRNETSSKKLWIIMDYRIHEEEVRQIDSCLFPIYFYNLISNWRSRNATSTWNLIRFFLNFCPTFSLNCPNFRIIYAFGGAAAPPAPPAPTPMHERDIFRAGTQDLGS